MAADAGNAPAAPPRAAGPVVASYRLNACYRYELVNAGEGGFISSWRMFDEPSDVFVLRGRASIEGRRGDALASVTVQAGCRATLPVGLLHRVIATDSVVEAYLPAPGGSPPDEGWP